MLIDAYYIKSSGMKIRLNTMPLCGAWDDIMCWADKKTESVSGVLGFSYVQAKCFGKQKCEHLDYIGWTPHHPEWKCAIGGKCDRWSTACFECPKAQEITEP